MTTIEENSPLRSVTPPSIVFDGHDLPECQVVLEDIFSSNLTEKFKMLKTNPDKTHSVSSHKVDENYFLEKLTKKDPISWPKMSDKDAWEDLDSAVGNLLVGGPTVFDRLSLLEESTYSEASRLFGFIKRIPKRFSGLNRRAQNSINLVKEKNTLLHQIKAANSQADKLSLGSLLDNVRARLRVLRRGESSRKRRWKIKQANQAFLKNPFEAGKKVLDPICNKVLQCTSSQLDFTKSKNLYDEKKNRPLTSLSGLPEHPTLSSDPIQGLQKMF